MTMQVLLSIVFGFGVLTLAAVALLNAAGQRLYELQVLDKRSRDFAFVYTYSSKPAADLRLSFSRLPLRLGSTAVVAVLVTYGLFVWAGSGASPTSVQAEGGVHPSLAEIITWTMMGAYVLALVGIATVLSTRLYGVLSTFRRGPFPDQAG